ncbi:MAG: ribosome-binding factor A [Sandaracinaceae bacterium]
MSRKSRSGRAGRQNQIKDAQLCAQVARTLSYSLGELPDALLGLVLIEVVPAPDAGRLAVRLMVPTEADVATVRAGLQAALPRMRSDVANAIHRKSVPTLMFELVPDVDGLLAR